MMSLGSSKHYLNMESSTKTSKGKNANTPKRRRENITDIPTLFSFEMLLFWRRKKKIHRNYSIAIILSF